ncbi:MAG: hypothetical protein AAGK82_02650 [Pseudomonadota bacterium]
MEEIAGTKPALRWVTNLSVIFLVVLWLVPTIGLLVSSFRDRDQISASGWWLAPFPVEQNFRYRAPADDVTRDGDLYVIEGNVFENGGVIVRFGGTRGNPTAVAAGETAELTKGRSLMSRPTAISAIRHPKKSLAIQAFIFRPRRRPNSRATTIGRYSRPTTWIARSSTHSR